MRRLFVHLLRDSESQSLDAETLGPQLGQVRHICRFGS